MDKALSEQLFNYSVNRPGELMISVSGIRGTIPDGLDPLNIVLFTMAFSSITGKKIILGNDARATGPFMKQIIAGTLMAAGKEVIDIGLAPTPTVKAAVRSWKADAGIMISASHNPPQWNAFKFIHKGGFFFDAKKFEELNEALKTNKYRALDYKKTGTLTTANGVQNHILSILEFIPNVKDIRKMKFPVVVDAVAGAGREALPELLRALGCKVTELYCEADPSGGFPRPPEPTPDALKKFGSLMKEQKAAIGFALDPDADRLVIGSPSVGSVNEEYTLPLALMGILPVKILSDITGKKLKKTAETGEKLKGTIVLNLSTSRLVDYVAEKAGLNVLRAPVGEANVVSAMRENRAIYGGEGNGGVIHPGIPSFGRDSLTGAALILSAMATVGAKDIDELLKHIPALQMKKTRKKIAGQPLDKIFKTIRDIFPHASIDERDGLHMTLEDNSWVHVRASNTEPVIRIIAEAPDKKKLKQILGEIEGQLGD